MAALAATALAGTAGIAAAADLDQPIFVEQAPEVVPVEIGNGWYIRGDLGYSLEVTSGTFHYRTYDSVADTYALNDFATGALTADLNAGIGAGYQFNQYLRGDVTLETFSGRFAGTTVAGSPCDPTWLGTTCRSTDTASFRAGSAMANAYVDLGTLVGITPYVGAGAGFTYMNWGDLTNTLYCVDGTVACDPDNNGPIVVNHDGADSVRFTYALMAGASYALTHNTKLDLGYRYSHVAGGDMFNFDAATAGLGAVGVQGTDKGFDRHDFRIGVRYSLW